MRIAHPECGEGGVGQPEDVNTEVAAENQSIQRCMHSRDTEIDKDAKEEREEGEIANGGANWEEKGHNLENGMRQTGAHQKIGCSPHDYPWFAPRYILNWVDAVWKDERDLWKCWTIDNHDSAEAYEELQWEVPKHLIDDAEIRGRHFHHLRNDLIQVELELDGIANKSDQEQQKIKKEVHSSTKRILMQWYQEAQKLNSQPENEKGDQNILKETRRNMDGNHADQEKEKEKVWRSLGQKHHVDEWPSSDGMLDCMWKGDGPKKAENIGELEDEDSGHLTCTVRGQ